MPDHAGCTRSSAVGQLGQLYLLGIVSSAAAKSRLSGCGGTYLGTESLGQMVTQCLIHEELPNGVPFSVPSSKARGSPRLHLLPDASITSLFF